MKPAFGYLRVSGKGQLDGDGEARQKQTILAFAARSGFNILRWFFDGGVTGEMDAGERPRYAEMLSLCSDVTTKTILVESSDRLGRTLVVCETACELARESGLTILSADSGMDLTNSDDPARVAMRQMMGVMAQMNKNVLIARLRKGRDRIREREGRCEGRKPHHAGDLTMGTISSMRQSGKSFREIASELNRRRVAAPAGNWWYPATVRNLLNRDSVQRVSMKHGSGLLAGLPV